MPRSTASKKGRGHILFFVILEEQFPFKIVIPPQLPKSF